MKRLFIFFLANIAVSLLAKSRCSTVFELLVEKSVEPGEAMGLDITSLRDFLANANGQMTAEQNQLLEEYFTLAKTYLELENIETFFPILAERIKKTTGEVSDEKLENILTEILNAQARPRLRNSKLIKSILIDATKKLVQTGKYLSMEEMKNQIRDALLIKFADFEGRFFDMLSRPEPSVSKSSLKKDAVEPRLVKLTEFDEGLKEIHDKQLLSKVAEIVEHISSGGLEAESTPKKPFTGYPGVYEFKLRIQPGYRIYFMKIPKSEKVLFMGITAKPKEGGNYSVFNRTYKKALEYLRSQP